MPIIFTFILYLLRRLEGSAQALELSVAAVAFIFYFFASSSCAAMSSPNYPSQSSRRLAAARTLAVNAFFYTFLKQHHRYHLRCSSALLCVRAIQLRPNCNTAKGHRTPRSRCRSALRIVVAFAVDARTRFPAHVFIKVAAGSSNSRRGRDAPCRGRRSCASATATALMLARMTSKITLHLRIAITDAMFEARKKREMKHK
jgi:hypothetical protein